MKQAVIVIDEETTNGVKVDCQLHGVPAIQVLEALNGLMKVLSRTVWDEAKAIVGDDDKLIEGYINAQQQARMRNNSASN